MSALGRAMLSIWFGIPLDPADADELGRIFDETPLYGLDDQPTDSTRRERA